MKLSIIIIKVGGIALVLILLSIILMIVLPGDTPYVGRHGHQGMVSSVSVIVFATGLILFLLTAIAMIIDVAFLEDND